MFPGMHFEVNRSPPQRNGRIFGCVYDVQKELLPKGKDSSSPMAEKKPQREFPESDNLARFHHTQQTSTTYWSHHRTNLPALSNR